MAERLTRVAVHFLPEFLNDSLRFGDARQTAYLDRRRAFRYFAPGQVFAYIRWEANEYGTRDWRIFVARAGDAALPLDRIPGITPGGELLLHLKGGDRVKKVLAAIDAVEALGLDAAGIAPDYWIYLQNRILARLPIRPYTIEQHRAYLARQEACA